MPDELEITTTFGTSHPTQPLIVNGTRFSNPRFRHSIFRQSAGTSGNPRSVWPQQQARQIVICPTTRRFGFQWTIQNTDIHASRTRGTDAQYVATHRNLEQGVKEALFREDLFYRLAVVPIHIPPLREPGDDFSGLGDVFCSPVATELKMPRRRLTAEALQTLQRYRFPGNVRELKNLIERACIRSSPQEIGTDDLPLAPKKKIPPRGTAARPVGFRSPLRTRSTLPESWRTPKKS